MKPYKDIKDEIKINRDACFEERLRVAIVNIESELNIAIRCGDKIWYHYFGTSKDFDVPKVVVNYIRKLGYIVRYSAFSDNMAIYLLDNTFKNRFLSFLHFYFGWGVI